MLSADWYINSALLNSECETVFGMFSLLHPTFAFNEVVGGWAVERWLLRGFKDIDLYCEYF